MTPQAVLKDQGTELSPEAEHEILAEVDRNRDGKIDYAEFCAMLLPRWVPPPLP